MKKQMLFGLLGILLMSGAPLRADETGATGTEDYAVARSETDAEEAVDCFYEYNQSNALCQKDKGSHVAAHAGQLRQGNGTDLETMN